MSTVTLNGEIIQVSGHFPKVGEVAKDFILVDQNLYSISLANFANKRKILNIVPSLDTPVCALSAKKFNASANQLDNTVVLVISADTPFAAKRFCTTEGLENVISASTFRSGRAFAEDYGVNITSGPLDGLTARAVIVLDENNYVIYAERVAEIKNEPNYDAVLAQFQK